MMYLEIRVETVARGETIDKIGGVVVTWEGSSVASIDELKKKSDKYRHLKAEGPAEVSVGLDEKVSGPPNTYSSVSVSVRVTLRCGQDAEQIKAARRLAYGECTAALEEYVGPAQELLIAHLQGAR